MSDWDTGMDQAEIDKGMELIFGMDPSIAKANKKLKNKDNDPKTKVKDSNPKIKVKDSDPKIKVKDSDPKIKVKDSDPKTKVKDSDPKTKVKDSDPKTKVKDSDPKTKVKDSDPKTKVKDSDPKTKVKDSDPKTKVKDSDPEIKVKDSDPKTKVKDSDPKIKVKDSDPKTKVKDSDPKIKVKDSDPKTKVKDSDPKTKVKDSNPKTKVKDSDPKIKVKDSDPKTKVKDSDPKIKVKDSDPETKVKDSDPETKVKDSDPKTKVKDSDPKTKVKDSDPKIKVKDSDPKIKVKDSDPKIKVKDSDPKIKVKDSDPEIKDKKFAIESDFFIVQPEAKPVITKNGTDEKESKVTIENFSKKIKPLKNFAKGYTNLPEEFLPFIYELEKAPNIRHSLVIYRFLLDKRNPTIMRISAVKIHNITGNSLQMTRDQVKTKGHFAKNIQIDRTKIENKDFTVAPSYSLQENNYPTNQAIFLPNLLVLKICRLKQPIAQKIAIYIVSQVFPNHSLKEVKKRCILKNYNSLSNTMNIPVRSIRRVMDSLFENRICELITIEGKEYIAIHNDFYKLKNKYILNTWDKDRDPKLKDKDRGPEADKDRGPEADKDRGPEADKDRGPSKSSFKSYYKSFSQLGIDLLESRSRKSDGTSCQKTLEMEGKIFLGILEQKKFSEQEIINALGEVDEHGTMKNEKVKLPWKYLNMPGTIKKLLERKSERDAKIQKAQKKEQAEKDAENQKIQEELEEKAKQEDQEQMFEEIKMLKENFPEKYDIYHAQVDQNLKKEYDITEDTLENHANYISYNIALKRFGDQRIYELYQKDRPNVH